MQLEWVEGLIDAVQPYADDPDYADFFKKQKGYWRSQKGWVTINGNHVLLDEDQESYTREANAHKLNGFESAALKAYTDGAYNRINAVMRGKSYGAGELDPESRAYAKDLLSAMNKTPNIGGMTLWRGLGPSALKDVVVTRNDGVAPITVEGAKYEVNTPETIDWTKAAGATFTDKGFTSVTSQPEAAVKVAVERNNGQGDADHGVIAEIKTDDGLPGLLVPPSHTDYPGEKEIIIAPNVQYHVESVEKVPVYWNNPGFSMKPLPGGVQGTMSAKEKDDYLNGLETGSEPKSEHYGDYYLLHIRASTKS